MSSITNNQSLRPMELLWGAQAVADELGITARQARHALSTGGIPGALKVGGRWAITRRALEEHFLSDAQ